MANSSYEFMKDVLAAPLGDLIASIGKGVGEAQAALDRGSLQQTLELYNGNPENSDEAVKLLREIGYVPSFYVLPKTTAKAKVTLAISQTKESSSTSNGRFATKMYASPVNATNTNTYNLDLNACAELEFEIVPVPPTEASAVRIMPPISKNAGGVKYFELSKVLHILDSYSINYELERDLESYDKVSILSVKIKSERVQLKEGETVIFPNDTLFIQFAD